MNSSKLSEVKFDLKFREFNEMTVQSCKFDRKGKLVLFGKGVKNKEEKSDKKVVTKLTKHNIVYVCSIEKDKTKLQKVFKLQKEAKLIKISRYYDKIWLRMCDDIYEWNLDNNL